MYTNLHTNATGINTDRFQTINQDAAHERMSDRYAFISTARVIDDLSKHGWHPASVQEARTRKDDLQGYQKHIVRLRQTDHLGLSLSDGCKVGDQIPEIVLVNSHAGASSLQLMLGVFRLICTNGMIVSDGMLNSCRIRHSGYTDDAVAEAVDTIAKGTDDVFEQINDFQTITLTPDEQGVYAMAAAELRYDTEKYDVHPSRMLMARRYQDQKSDLWTVFNRVQENIIRGGVVQEDKTKVDRWGRKKTRRATKVKGVNDNVRINKALWTLTEKMAELKK